jgi:hypothetical protein
VSGDGRGRHRAPSQPSLAKQALKTTGAVTALIGGGLAVTAGSAQAATASDFQRLAQCESGGNYSINTGNGFYGAFQFDLQTWHGLGYSGRPDQASPATQNQAAYKLYNSRGWSPWPSCSAQLGLSNNGDIAVPAGGAQQQAAPQPSSIVNEALTPKKATLVLPRYDGKGNSYKGTVLSMRYVEQFRLDTLVWQQKMRARKFMLPLDGKFGQQSSGVASLYTYLTKVKDGSPGQVGPQMWQATVRSPV